MKRVKQILMVGVIALMALAFGGCQFDTSVIFGTWDANVKDPDLGAFHSRLVINKDKSVSAIWTPMDKTKGEQTHQYTIAGDPENDKIIFFLDPETSDPEVAYIVEMEGNDIMTLFMIGEGGEPVAPTTYVRAKTSINDYKDLAPAE